MRRNGINTIHGYLAAVISIWYWPTPSTTKVIRDVTVRTQRRQFAGSLLLQGEVKPCTKSLRTRNLSQCNPWCRHSLQAPRSVRNHSWRSTTVRTIANPMRNKSIGRLLSQMAQVLVMKMTTSSWVKLSETIWDIPTFWTYDGDDSQPRYNVV